MVRILRRFVLFLSLIAFASGEPSVAANPVGEFFKRVGRSISNLGKSPTPTPTPRRSRAGHTKRRNGRRQKGHAESSVGHALGHAYADSDGSPAGHGCSDRPPAITRSALRRGDTESARVGDQSLRAQSRVGGCACVSQVHGSHGPFHGQGLPYPVTASFTGSARLLFGAALIGSPLAAA